LATPISAKHKPKKQRIEKPRKPAKEERKDDEDDEEGQITFQGTSVGQMDRDPDLHTKWVGLRVMYLDSHDAEPVLGTVTESKKTGQQEVAGLEEHRSRCSHPPRVGRSAERKRLPGRGGCL
jgi:hypothetical protein